VHCIFLLVIDFVFSTATLFADSERTQLINMNKPIEPDAFDPKLYSFDVSEQVETTYRLFIYI